MRFSARNFRVVIAALGVGVIVASGLAARSAWQNAQVTEDYTSPPITLIPAASSFAEIRDADITFYRARLEADLTGAADRASLATLLFARARESGSMYDLDEAERLARAAVVNRTERNGVAFELLATILMTKHEFLAARAVMLRADSVSPRTPSHLALLGEIELELGEYQSAAERFRAVHYDGEQFTIGARVARWYELTGHTDIARAVLMRAINRVNRRDDLPRDQVAWFHYRLGDLELRVGRYAAADSAFARALSIRPEDVRALGGLARSAVAQQRWEQALEYGARATVVQLDPATIGAMSIAYRALGDSAQARRFAETMAVSALAQPGSMHRGWGLFLLDHGTAVDRARVLYQARISITTRPDVYGHDLLAWALYRNGLANDARKHMSLALDQHTEDVMLEAHARAIGAPRSRERISAP